MTTGDTTKSHGLTNPDERNVAVLEWKRKGNGKPFVVMDDPNRRYVLVPATESDAFEESATAQGWQYKTVGYDHWLNRWTYAIESIPEPEFKALDLTKPKDVAALRKAIAQRPKRFRTSGLREKAETVVAQAMEIAMGEMSNPDTGSTDEAKEALARRKVKGAELGASLAKTVVDMEKVVQADDHLDDKNQRLDEGKATENLGITKTYVVEQEIADRV